MGFNSLAFSASLVFSPYLGMKVVDHFGYDTLWYITAGILAITSVGFYWIVPKLKN